MKIYVDDFADDFMDKMEDDLGECIRETMLDAHATATERSRVKTGRYRGNVQYLTGEPPSENEIGEPWNDGSVAIDKVDLNTTHSIVNNVPYVDAEWSQSEVVEPTAARAESVLDAKIEERFT